ncbi:MAG TPA: terminase small subunit [Stellaceae bacterium]|nr:terminase small subunit [Stellaceae bacterium]
MRRRQSKERAGPSEVEEIAERAARLGITVDRVLWEYAAIAFADLRHMVEEDTEGGFRIRPLSKMSDADVAAISEIVPGAEAGRSRVKLYDRKAALDAIARHLGMFPSPRRQQAAPTEDQEEDPREFLARELARLAAEAAEGQPDLGSDPRARAEDQA